MNRAGNLDNVLEDFILLPDSIDASNGLVHLAGVLGEALEILLAACLLQMDAA